MHGGSAAMTTSGWARSERSAGAGGSVHWGAGAAEEWVESEKAANRTLVKTEK